MKNFYAMTILLALNSTTSFGATSGTLLIQGMVAKKVSIAVSPQAIASALDLEVSQTDLKVASVNEKSNSNTGYKVTITSANLGKLKRSGGAEVFSYTIKYGGTNVALSSAAGTVISSASAAVANVNKDMNISYTGVSAETMVEGSYSDTITLNIASN